MFSKVVYFIYALAVGVILAPLHRAEAQTPYPFAVWQSAPGITLRDLGGPVPDWQIVTGGGAVVSPSFEGSKSDSATPVPSFDIRYKDDAFLSAGEGLGWNVFHGKTYRAGVSLTYDAGRSEDAARHINGIGSIGPAAEPKLFAEVALLPFVISVNVRHQLGATEGTLGDLGVYIPVAATDTFAAFVGPSLTWGDHQYMEKYFGVTASQSTGSRMHLPTYTAHGGIAHVNFGASADWAFSPRWILDAEIGYERLIGSAAESPISETNNGLTGVATVSYKF